MTTVRVLILSGVINATDSTVEVSAYMYKLILSKTLLSYWVQSYEVLVLVIMNDVSTISVDVWLKQNDDHHSTSGWNIIQYHQKQFFSG